MSRNTEEIAAFHARGLERDRLAGGSGALELARTQALLERYLPPSPAVIADVVGGPGRYAIWLAERGYRVHLVDPVPLHVEQASIAARNFPGAALASPRWATRARSDCRTRTSTPSSSSGHSTI
jgi:hypothetical protein